MALHCKLINVSTSQNVWYICVDDEEGERRGDGSLVCFFVVLAAVATAMQRNGKELR